MWASRMTRTITLGQWFDTETLFWACMGQEGMGHVVARTFQLALESRDLSVTLKLSIIVLIHE